MLDRMAKLDAWLREAIERDMTPGMVCLVGRGAETLLYEAYGWAQLLPEKEKMTRETTFDLASVSKLVGTWATLLPLLQSGKVSLTDPGPTPNGATVWNLLTHTGGFIPGCHTSEFGDTRDKRIRGLFNLPPERGVGEKVAYSDISFIALGEVIEKATGLPLDRAARALWDALDMRDTCYNPPKGTFCAATEFKKGVLRRGFVHDEVSGELGGVAGHAGVFSTAKDLQKFCRAIFPGDHSPIFEREWLVKSFTNQTAHLGDNRCLGWIAYRERPEGNIVGHTGFTGTSLWLDLAAGEYVVLLSNRVHPSRDRYDMYPVRKGAFELLYGGEY